VKTLLDTDGDALLHGLEAGPTIVGPNQQEAERLLNRALLTRSNIRDAVERIHEWARTPLFYRWAAAVRSGKAQTTLLKRYRRESRLSARLERAML
jgi:hypothetical protein